MARSVLLGGGMQPDEIRELLVLHQRTYELLLHLSTESLRTATALSPADVQALGTRTGAKEWLKDHWQVLPPALRPSLSYDSNGIEKPDLVATANLLASFLKVSFRVSHFEWNDTLVDTRVVTGAPRDPSPRGTRTAKLEALTRLCRMHGRIPSPRELHSVVRDPKLANDVTLCTYVWQLRQRALGKQRGPEVHSLWRSLPAETRRDMSEPRVSAALRRVLDAVSAANACVP